jgi:uncharacterized protein
LPAASAVSVHNSHVAHADVLNLSSFRLRPGDGRRLEVDLELGGLELAGQQYFARPQRVSATLDVSCMTGGGYALRLRFDVAVSGPCMRCLSEAAPMLAVDAREVNVPAGGDELDSPYVTDDVIDLRGWAHDAFALAVPDQILCQLDCPGLCPVCAISLRDAGADHRHAGAPDPRWAKLGQMRLD